MRLTKRDEELLLALSRSVRLLTPDQISKCWWHESENGIALARRRLRQLAAHGHVQRVQVFARRLSSVSTPVYCWCPGQSSPNFEAISYKLQSRWQAPPRRITAFIAGTNTRKAFGCKGTGELKRSFQMGHDIGLSDVFVHYFVCDPTLIQYWWGEDQINTKGKKVPDAVIATSRDARPDRVVEFGGSYNARRVEQFHATCKREKLEYELW